MKIKKGFLAKSILGLVTAIVAQNAAAIGNFTPLEGELARLPPYCAARAERWGDDADRSDIRPWVLIYGRDWFHMHHFCAGLNFINRAYRGVDLKVRNLNLALDELGYIERNAKTALVLSETYVALGEAFLGLKRNADALIALNKALAIAPDMAKAHVKLAAYYVDAGQKELAMAAVIEGLKRVPDNKSLLRRYTELGGKPPLPTPYGTLETPEKPTIAPAETPPTETGNTPDPDSANDRPVVDLSTSKSSKDPANPWCRFCPDTR